MPRNSRIRMVGKYEARERRKREQELRELLAELRRQWRERDHYSDELTTDDNE